MCGDLEYASLHTLSAIVTLLPWHTCTIMRVLLSPLSESCRRYVRREFLKGTCECLERRALMTSPSADSDLLMHWASRRRLPSAPDLAIRSEPARSTRFSLPAIDKWLFHICISIERCAENNWKGLCVCVCTWGTVARWRVETRHCDDEEGMRARAVFV